jgi:hypothetical protein
MRDRDIRDELLPLLNSQYKNDSDTLIVEELGLCQGIARIDLAVVNGSIHGYEIKSEKDNLKRLQTQQEIYNKVLDYVTIVADTRHLHKIEQTVPSWWGIEEVTVQNGMPCTSALRTSTRNPAVDPSALVQLLWRDEALTLLKTYNLLKGVSSKPRKVLWDRLASSLSLSELSAGIREIIKARDNWRAA